MGKNRSSIFQVSDVTSYELFDYSKKFKNYINDVVFFTKNDPGHGDIFLNEKLYTYFHDIDYDNNIIYEDKFTCRLTRDRENHALQLTYISCSMDEVTFFVYNDTSIENPYTMSYDVKFTINNPVENLIHDTDEGLITETHNLGNDIALTNIGNNEYTIDCDRHSALEDNIIFTYVHNGQNYNYILPIKCIEVDAPCQDIVLYPEVSYLYAGQIQQFSYYSIPQYSSDKYSFYNIPMSYNDSTENGYDVAYVKCGDKVAYSYVYMAEPKIENILTYLYFTDKYLTANHAGKISATIYPPEIHTYALGNGSSYNITFFVNGNQIPNTYVYKDENDVIYALFGFGNAARETNQSYYYFENAGQYEISSRITYQGQISENSVNYPVGIEPHLCSSIKAYLENNPSNVNYSNPLNINSRSDYDTGIIPNNTLRFIVERYYEFENNATFDSNPILKQTVQKNSDAHFEHENYGNYKKLNELPESQQYSGSYYRELFEITSADNIENGTIDELTFYANDGSHNSYSLDINFVSKYITPNLKNINAYLVTNSAIDINNPAESICTNPRKTYKLLSYYEPQNATVFNNLQYGESSITSHFITHSYTIENISNKNYISFISECNTYVNDNINIKFFAQNNLSSTYINLPVQNSGGILEGIYYVTQLTYMGLNGTNIPNNINIAYLPENSPNVYLENMTYSFIPDNPNYYRKIDLQRLPDKEENGVHYFSYKVNYNDVSWNDNGVIINIQPKVCQVLNESTNEMNIISGNGNIFLTPRSARISVDKQVIDKSHYGDQTETDITLTISSGMNVIANNELYYGYKKGNSNFTYVKLNGNSTYTISKTVTVDISSNDTYTFAIFHKALSSYVKISSDITVDIITTTVQVNTIYEISFEKSNYLVNEEMTLRLLVNSDANDVSTLSFNPNSSNYNFGFPTFGEKTEVGRYLTYKITSLTDNIYSLSQRFLLKVNTNINSSLYASTTIYPTVDVCKITFTRNNVESNDIYENGSQNYKQLKVSVLCKKSLSGAVIPESELMSLEYQVGNSELGNIQNGIYYANDNEVGNQTITPIVNNVQYSPESFKQYTLPYSLESTKRKLWGYNGYEEDITITSKFKEGIKYNNYKKYTLQYYYMQSLSDIHTIDNEEINDITISVGHGDCAIVTPYNTNVSIIIDIEEKEITDLSLEKTLYVKGGNKDYFSQYITVSGTNTNGLAIGELGENYNVQSSIAGDNTLMVFNPPAIYNNRVVVRYYFPTPIGNTSFNLQTSIDSERHIAYEYENNIYHSLTYEQTIIPLTITEISECPQYSCAYAYTRNPITQNGIAIYEAKVKAGAGIIPQGVLSISLNNMCFESNDPSEMSSYFFVHEYAVFSNKTAYASSKYSAISPSNITDSSFNIAISDSNWRILNGDEYEGAGSYYTYLSVLWYDDSISNILPKYNVTINGETQTVSYEGVYRLHDGYIIPLTYNIILNNDAVKTTLDNHLISQYTLCTGEGNKEAHSNEIYLGPITVNLSNNTISVYNLSVLNKLASLSLVIKYYNGYNFVETTQQIWNGNTETINADAIKQLYKWKFDNWQQPQYLTEVVKVKYALKSGYTQHYLENSQSVTIKYYIGNSESHHFGSSTWYYNQPGGINGAKNEFTQYGCINSNVVTTWNAFDLSFNITNYVTSIEKTN